MKKVQLIINYWQDNVDKTSDIVVSWSAVHVGGKHKVHAKTFKREHYTTFEAWFEVLFDLIKQQLLVYSQDRQPVSIDIVTHTKLTKNEHSSIRSLFATYKHFADCDIDDLVMATARRLVVKGKQMTDAMRMKQKLVELMLMCKRDGESIEFTHTYLSTTTRGHTASKFMANYEAGKTQHEIAQTNVVQFPLAK